MSKFLTNKIIKSGIVNDSQEIKKKDKEYQRKEDIIDLQQLLVHSRSRRTVLSTDLDTDTMPHSKHLWSKVFESDNRKRLARNKRAYANHSINMSQTQTDSKMLNDTSDVFITLGN